MFGWVLLIIVGLMGLYFAVAYNSLVRLRNLVEAVKGYMQFERDTLTQVIEARARAISAPDQASRVAAENQLTGGLGRLLAVMENYPQLKADQNVLQLQ